MKLEKSIAEIQKRYNVVGREREIESLLLCLEVKKHVLLEGPVGVGKTHLVSAVSDYAGRKVVRVDGDTRYTEQKLSGWFDPPTVLKKGYSEEAYFDGPLANAMREGGILFINELNRMPEGVQNILLPALDENKIELPRVGTLKAKAGFSVIATMNPRDFVATTHISEALLDRFELVYLDYQSEAEERRILELAGGGVQKQAKKNAPLLDWTLSTVRNTRQNPLFKRGASIRAGISIYELALAMGGDWSAFERACLLALPNRLELSDEALEEGITGAIRMLTEEVKKK